MQRIHAFLRNHPINLADALMSVLGLCVLLLGINILVTLPSLISSILPADDFRNIQREQTYTLHSQWGQENTDRPHLADRQTRVPEEDKAIPIELVDATGTGTATREVQAFLTYTGYEEVLVDLTPERAHPTTQIITTQEYASVAERLKDHLQPLYTHIIMVKNDPTNTRDTAVTIVLGSTL